MKNKICRIVSRVWSMMLVLIIWPFNSCSDFLEQPETAGNTPEVVFSDFNLAEEVLAGAYALMPTGICNAENSSGPWSWRVLIYTGNLSNMSDESDTYSQAAEPGCVDRIFQKGGLDPTTIMAFHEDKWTYNFQAIRNCHLYLANIDKVVKNGTPELIAQRKAEAKILLAMKYFEIFRRYGGVPWVPGLVTVGDPNAIQPRLTVEQTVNMICGYLDEAIAEPNLPMKSADQDFGRATKAAAYMLKARTLLYAASPLFNTVVFPFYGQQELVRYGDISASAVANRWKAAKDCAENAVAKLNAAGYWLIGEQNGVVDRTLPANADGSNFKKSCDLLTFPSAGNTEIVWGVRGDVNGTINGNEFWGPYQKSWYTGNRGHCTYLPLQNIVDQFELKTGEMQPVDQYASTRPYDNLEARFHQSILYHGAQITQNVNPVRTIDFTTNGENYPVEAVNFTGYSQRKFLDDPHMAWQVVEVNNVFWPYMRLADLYLILAECANECDDTSLALKWLNKVRNRAGQPSLENTARWHESAQNKDYLRACIKNERTVELAFENQRYFDLKRWLMGYENVNYRGEGKGSIGGQMYWMKVDGTSASPSFVKTPFEIRTFSDKFYFYPIPQNEIYLSGGKLVQNPGW